MRIDLLKRLCDTPRIPGHEARIRAILILELCETCDEVSNVALGNAVGVKLGPGGTGAC